MIGMNIVQCKKYVGVTGLCFCLSVMFLSVTNIINKKFQHDVGLSLCFYFSILVHNAIIYLNLNTCTCMPVYFQDVSKCI